jgi:hypothetical protein
MEGCKSSDLLRSGLTRISEISRDRCLSLPRSFYSPLVPLALVTQVYSHLFSPSEQWLVDWLVGGGKKRR